MKVNRNFKKRITEQKNLDYSRNIKIYYVSLEFYNIKFVQLYRNFNIWNGMEWNKKIQFNDHITRL